ncbi:P-type Ca(2+)-ATPase, putative [Eimeria maxima]|uniref:P-type sodium-transporting ATPase4 n=1 Tax=Eimeria maxima TaxID=5804 RepID=U6M0J4_EIMMA|nr:P-type Ca(2+)-ATPase, putative [Eimeria maxima]CDJ57747.1 P-type Ca(2+)-ATPase, putative [Eimeria maxima]
MAEPSQGGPPGMDGLAAGGGGDVGGFEGGTASTPAASAAAAEAPTPAAAGVAATPSGGRADAIRLSPTRSEAGEEMELSSSPSVRESGVESFIRSDTARMVPQALDPSAYPDNVEMEILERLSKSQVSLKELVESARKADPEAFRKMVTATEREFPTSGKNRFASTPIEELAREFGCTDINQGLTSAQVLVNREKYGRNMLDRGDRDPLYKIFLSQFWSPVVLLLLIAAVASLVMQEWVEGAAILIIVTLNACLATYMENSASTALAKLASMAAPMCCVLREGKERTVPAEEVVPGDIVFLATGNSVAADMRCVDVTELKTNEAILTGKHTLSFAASCCIFFLLLMPLSLVPRVHGFAILSSLHWRWRLNACPSEDVAKTVSAVDGDAPFASNLCFASTIVTNGSGKCLVYATGMETQVGRIATQLKKAGAASRLTPLQRGLNRLGGLIGLIAICVLVVIVVVAVLTGYRDPAHPDSDPVFTIVLVAVGFAVSSIPEGLPMVVTICLSLGARDMVKRRANVRKLPAVETLGCCSVICSDKTGTLTEGKMTATHLVSFSRGGSIKDQEMSIAKTFAVYPTKGFDPRGGFFDAELLTEQKKNTLAALHGQGAYESFGQILTDYGSAEMAQRGSAAASAAASAASSSSSSAAAPASAPADCASAAAVRVRAFLTAALLNSHSTKLEQDPKTKRWTTTGNMSEGKSCALVVAAAKAGLTAATRSLFPRESSLEVPFNSGRKMAVSVHKLQTSNQFADILLADDSKVFTHVAIVKGAPDRMFPHLGFCLSENEGVSRVSWRSPLTEEEKAEIKAANDKLSSAALRVLAVAIKPLTDDDVEELKGCAGADERLHTILEEPPHSLVILGLVGSLDPPRAGVREAVRECHGAGVRVAMITGDQLTTACAIAKDIGILTEDEDVSKRSVTCAVLHQDDDPSLPYKPNEEIDDLVDGIRVFARAQPEDKFWLVSCLQRLGHTVAMTGDGVNDAPALKAADIGVAMGVSGTDVAKGAAEMILLDDNFCTIVAAVEEGRKIYGNIQKFVCFLLGTNIGEIIYLTIAIAASMPLPLEALQVLFLNLMSDGCPAVALAKEPPDDDNMSVPPRNRKQPIMTRDWWLFGNLPHTLFEAACVLLSLAMGLYLCTGSILLKDLTNKCNTVTVVDSVGHESTLRYFCYSNEYRVSSDYTGWVTNIDYFSPSEGGIVQVLGAARGKHYDLSVSSSSLLPSVAEDMAKGCPDPLLKDELGWCRPADRGLWEGGDNIAPLGLMPNKYFDVSSRGAKMARTCSFISAVWDQFCLQRLAFAVVVVSVCYWLWLP